MSGTTDMALLQLWIYPSLLSILLGAEYRYHYIQRINHSFKSWPFSRM